MWCRREARVRWWELDEREVAEDLLRQAQLISPKSVEQWLEESRMSVPKDAVCRLYEGLVSFPDESGFDLLTALAALYQGANRNEEAVEVLKDAARRVTDDGQRLQVVAGMASELSAIDLQVQALEQAYRNDAKYFEDLEAGLTQAGRYKKLVQTLVNRAQVLELEGSLEPSQRLLERAAHLAQSELDDGEWALELLEKAASLTKNVEDLETAFNLAFEREDLLAQERMISGILEGSEDKDKSVVYLRHLVRVQETQGLFEETAESLTKLVDLDAASDEEQLRLASLVLDTDPLRAAKMLESLADQREGVDAGRLYFESCYGYCAAQ